MTPKQVFALSTVVALLISPLYARAGETTPGIAPAELMSRLDDGTAPIVVDVRSPAEYRSGHIAGAVNIPHDQIGEHVSELRNEAGVALYCMVGPRARLAEAILKDAAVADVIVIEGGFAAWQANGLPTEAETAE